MLRSKTVLLIVTLSTILESFLSHGESCVPLRGVDDDYSGSISSSSVINKIPDGNIFITFITGGVDPILSYETPIALRITHLMISVIYSVLTAFDSVAIDRFGRKELSNARRRCPESKEKNSTLFNLHRNIALSYALYLPGKAIFKENPEVLTNILVSFGLDPTKPEKECKTADTPWCLAYVLTNEIIELFSQDGWNADGLMSRQFNPIPYQDFRKRLYKPSNDKNFRKWAQLLESDGRGFLYEQQHVVPHIGDTAKSLHFSNEQICKRSIPPPRYYYKKEIERLFKRTRSLSSAKKRAEVVVFDNKINSLVPLQFQFLLRKGFSIDSLEVMAYDLAMISASSEAVVVAWKEKIKHNAVRPPTVISYLLGNKRIRAYAGPGKNIQELPANQWMPYIRTMPHAEYPSGSSCLCQVFKETMINIAGTDDIISQIQGPLVSELRKGQNPFEPNDPKENITLTFNTFSAISDACSESRLNAGLHFQKAVPEGQKLCSGISEVVLKDILELVKGNIPKYSDAYQKPTIRQSRCK